MLTLPQCKETLARFKSQHSVRYGISRIGIFGSVARGDNTAASDIDIVVDVARPTLSGMYSLRTSLAELFGCQVDVVRMRGSLSPALRENIERDAVYV